LLILPITYQIVLLVLGLATSRHCNVNA